MNNDLEWNYEAIEAFFEDRRRQIEEVARDRESVLRAMQAEIKEQELREAAEESAKLPEDLFKI